MVGLCALGAVPHLRTNFALLACIASTGAQAQPCTLSADLLDHRGAYHLGVNAFRAGHHSRATMLLETALKEDPSSDVSALFLGMAYSAAGKQHQALETWRRSGAYRYFLFRGLRNGSVDDLETAIAAGANDPNAYFKLGDLLWDQKAQAGALDAYRRGLLLAPAHSQVASLARGRVLEGSGQWQSALAAYAEHVATWPTRPEAYLRAAGIHRTQVVLPEQAFAWAERCVANAGSLECYIAAGEIRRDLGDYDSALRWGSMASRAHPGRSAALVFIGATWELRGHLGQADAAYAQAAVLEPKNFWIPYARGLIHLKHSNFAQAEMHLNRAAALNQASWGVELALAEVYCRTGRETAALAAFRRAAHFAGSTSIVAQFAQACIAEAGRGRRSAGD